MIKNKYILLAVVAGLVVLADQITKALILQYLPYHQSITVIAGFFDITHIHNPGGAFGIMAEMGETVRTIVFLLASSLAVGLIFYFYKKNATVFHLSGYRICADIRGRHRKSD